MNCLNLQVTSCACPITKWNNKLHKNSKTSKKKTLNRFENVEFSLSLFLQTFCPNCHRHFKSSGSQTFHIKYDIKYLNFRLPPGLDQDQTRSKNGLKQI